MKATDVREFVNILYFDLVHSITAISFCDLTLLEGIKGHVRHEFFFSKPNQCDLRGREKEERNRGRGRERRREGDHAWILHDDRNPKLANYGTHRLKRNFHVALYKHNHTYTYIRTYKHIECVIVAAHRKQWWPLRTRCCHVFMYLQLQWYCRRLFVCARAHLWIITLADRIAK